MAKGDVVSSLSDISTGGNLDYQPASGVEVMITCVSAESGTSLQVKLINGTLVASTIRTASFVSEALSQKVLVNNTNYFRISNGFEANSELGFTGIQTK